MPIGVHRHHRHSHRGRRRRLPAGRQSHQPRLRAEVEACFAAAPPGAVETHVEHDEGQGRIEQRTTGLMREVDWLSGDHFALNLVRSARDKKPVKLRRKVAGWTPDYLDQLLNEQLA